MTIIPHNYGGFLTILVLISFYMPQTDAQTCLVIPSNGPFAGGTIVVVTNTSGRIGDGEDITNVTLGGQTATCSSQGTNWALFMAPFTGVAGIKDIIIHSASVGDTFFGEVYTVNFPGQIGGIVRDWTRWQEVPGLPEARQGMAAGVLGGVIYAMGGYDGSGIKSNVFKFNGTNWIQVTGLPVPRAYLGAGVLNNALYAVGGGSGLDTNVYRYNGTNWQKVAAMPTLRYGLAVSVLNNTLYAVGGFNGSSAQTNVYLYDGNYWTEVAGLPKRRHYLASGVLNGALYAIGGSSGAGSPQTNTVYRYNGTYWAEAEKLPSTRSLLAADVLEGSLYVVGGYDGNEAQTNVYRYDGTNWTEVVGLPAARSYLAATVLNGALYAIGGSAGGIIRTNVYRYPYTVMIDPGVIPISASCTGGYPIVINGINLGNGKDITAVTLCGMSVSGIVTQSTTQVVVTAAAGTSGTGDVVVYSTSYGMTVKSNAFCYNPLITVEVGSHGTVSPSGMVNIAYGGTTSFVIAADGYYHIKDVVTNGVVIGAGANQRLFTSVWNNVKTTGILTVVFGENLTTNTDTPEWWLAQFGWTNNFGYAAANDTDGDGMPAWAEYLAGTIPTNRGSSLSFTNVALEAETPGIIVRWLSVDGKFYRLERGSNLLGKPHFVDLIRQNIPGTAPINTETDKTVVGPGPWFYRVKLE